MKKPPHFKILVKAAVLQAARTAVVWRWVPSESRVLESGVQTLSDCSCRLISIHLVVSQVGLVQVSAYLAC